MNMEKQGVVQGTVYWGISASVPERSWRGLTDLAQLAGKLTKGFDGRGDARGSRAPMKGLMSIRLCGVLCK
jgi:hypothetical protein